MNEKIPPIKKRKLCKKKEKEYEIKRNIQTSNQNWNDLEFQIQWNKLEWANPRNWNEQKNPYCVFSKNFYLKDNNKTAYWVDNYKLKLLDTDDLSKRNFFIDGIQSSLIGTKIEQSASGKKMNTDLLQAAEEQEPEEGNDDAEVNSE